MSTKRIAKLTLTASGAIIMMPPDMPTSEKMLEQIFGLKKIERASWADDPKSQQQPGGLTGNEKYKPLPEDLVRVPFRALSATIVAGGTWRATDFSNEKVLKAGMNLIVGKPAYQDHMQWGNSYIGSIESAAWSPKNGNVPGGINIVYLVDGKANEKLARALLMDPPAIHSNSVTVEFEWEPSHEFKSEDDFIRALGSVGGDGIMVCRVVTKIINFYESSILFMGADPYAKMLDDKGNPINIDKGSTYDEQTSYTKELYTRDHTYYHTFSFKKEKEFISLSQEKPEENPTPQMKDTLIQIRTLLKLADDATITKEQFAQVNFGFNDKGEIEISLKKAGEKTPEETIAELTQTIKDRDKTISEFDISKADTTLRELNKALKSDMEELQKENDRLELEARNNVEKIKLGENVFADLKKEAIDLYKKFMGADAADANVIGLFEKAEDKKAVEGLINQYTKGVKERFNARCKGCGSTELEFRSTYTPDNENPGGDGDADKSAKTDDQYRSDFKSRY